MKWFFSLHEIELTKNKHIKKIIIEYFRTYRFSLQLLIVSKPMRRMWWEPASFHFTTKLMNSGTKAIVYFDLFLFPSSKSMLLKNRGVIRHCYTDWKFGKTQSLDLSRCRLIDNLGLYKNCVLHTILFEISILLHFVFC